MFTTDALIESNTIRLSSDARDDWRLVGETTKR